MHQSSYNKMTQFRSEFLTETDALNIYDLGSQDVNGSYRSIFDHENWNYVGIDMAPGANVDIVLQNPYSWREIDSESVDVLVSGQAFEHIEFFWLSMLEVFRVLKPGGLLCLIAPSAGPEHRYPVDCWRFYPDGFSALAKFSQLVVLSAKTQWESEGYADGSDQWQDSVLICRKPIFPLFTAFKAKVKNRLQHAVLAH